MRQPKKMLAEVEKLKQDWIRDPCWDIEDSQGFEEYYEELLLFRRAQEALWQARLNEQYQRKAQEIGCPGNLTLAAYVLRLEGRIGILENKLN